MDDSTHLKAQEAKPIEEGKRESQARAQKLAAVKADRGWQRALAEELEAGRKPYPGTLVDTEGLNSVRREQQCVCQKKRIGGRATGESSSLTPRIRLSARSERDMTPPHPRSLRGSTATAGPEVITKGV